MEGKLEIRPRVHPFVIQPVAERCFYSFYHASIVPFPCLVQVKLFPGRKLEYEPKHCEKQRNDRDFLTAVEFSVEDPYGKALALFDFKSGTVKVNYILYECLYRFEVKTFQLALPYHARHLLLKK